MKKLMDAIRCDLQTSYGGMFESPFEPNEITKAYKRVDGKRRLGMIG